MPNLGGLSLPKRESRQPDGWTAPEMSLGGDTPFSSRNALRQQFLNGRYGVSNDFAALLAPLIWEARRD